MKRFWTMLALLTFGATLLPAVSFADTPGAGFDPSVDPCAYILGPSNEFIGSGYSAGKMNFVGLPDAKRACVTQGGYFYELGTQESWMHHSLWGNVNFTWDANPNNNPRIDPLTGLFTGAARMTQLGSVLGRTPRDVFLQFDWVCPAGANPSTDCDPLRPKVNMQTGAITGVAWNVETGYVTLTGMSMEIPPMEIQAFVDIYANSTKLTPLQVALDDAPQADGFQYWRASVRFYDVAAQTWLKSTDITAANISLVTEGHIYLDQVHNTGYIGGIANESKGAFVTETKNPSVVADAAAGVAGCGALTGTAACVMKEVNTDPAAVSPIYNSWNSFVYSAAPTSNTLGLRDATGRAIAYPVDRDGGIGFYPDDPWNENDYCVVDCNVNKADVFYDRSLNRNRVAINQVSVSNLTFSPSYLNGRNYTLKWSAQPGGQALNAKAFTYDVPENARELKFQSPLKFSEFSYVFNGRPTMKIPDDSEAIAEEMDIGFRATLLPISPEKARAGYSRYGSYYFYTRTDESVQSAPSDYSTTGYKDNHFLITGAYGNPSQTQTENWIAARWGSSSSSSSPAAYQPSVGKYPDWWFRAQPWGSTKPCYVRTQLHVQPITLPDGTVLDYQCGSGFYEDPVTGQQGVIGPGPTGDTCVVEFDVYCDDPNDGDDRQCTGPAYVNDTTPFCTDQEFVTYTPTITINKGLPYHEFNYNLGSDSDNTTTFNFHTKYQQPKVIDNNTPRNNLKDPSFEQYVCTLANTTGIAARFGVDAATVARGKGLCHYVSYLSVKDVKTDPYPLHVIGSVDQQDSQSALDTLGSDVAVLGSSDIGVIRNKLYAQIVRYALGQSSEGGSGSVEDLGSRGVVSLMDGRLLFSQGDVTIDGSTGFEDTTLAVLDGDVYLNGDVTGGRLQILVFGGNIYIDPSVKDLNVNIFTDGSVFSDSGSYVGTTGVPVWPVQGREDTLKRQLTISGTVFSCNSVKGSETADASGNYSIGCGRTTTDPLIAREYDLNKLRQFKLCYVLDAQGQPTEDVMACENTLEEISARFKTASGSGISTSKLLTEGIYSLIIDHQSPSSRQLDFGIF